MTPPGPPSEPKRSILPLVAVVGILVAIALLSTRLDVQELHNLTRELDGTLVFLLLVILPLFGFPVSVLHVLAGIRWGARPGLELVVLSIFFQLLASYALVYLFRPVFERRLQRVKDRVPTGAHGAVSLFTMLLPGVPYFAKNYVLPLVGVPLPTYLLWAFPLHSLRSSVAVLFGDASNELTPLKIALFIGYGVLITASCAWAFRKLKEKGAFAPRAKPAL